MPAPRVRDQQNTPKTPKKEKEKKTNVHMGLTIRALCPNEQTRPPAPKRLFLNHIHRECVQLERPGHLGGQQQRYISRASPGRIRGPLQPLGGLEAPGNL